MPETNIQKQGSSPDQKRIFNSDFSDMPSIAPGTGDPSKPRFIGKELDAMCKNPRQSADLIRYLIEFIKSL
jgi:hypothetical protein